MERKYNHLLAFTAFCLLFFSLCLSRITYASTPDNSWHFLFAPYLWATGLDGTMTIANHTSDVHESFKDLIDHLDFGAEAHLEANYGRWTLMVDPTYMKLSDDFTIDTLNNKITQKLWLVDTGIFFRALESHLTQPTSFELLAGGRYMGIGADLDIGSLFSFSNNEDSLSPIFGARIKHYFTPRTQFWIRGDYGGFHVNGMNETWSANAGLAYAVLKHLEIGIAYRVLKLDFTDDANHFAMNTLMYGPMLGIGFFD